MLDALGNVGDFLGGIGVLITLLYLASQIKQNSRSVRNAAAESVLQSMNATLQTASASPQLSRVLAVGQTDIGQLTDDERYQFVFWIYSWFRVLERAYAHYQEGYIDPGEWDGHAMNLTSLMASPSVQQWWNARRAYFGPEFRTLVDSLETDAAAPSAGEVARALSPSAPNT